VPAWGVFLILARELTVAGWRVSQTTISGANIWGKLKTVSQIGAIALLIAPLPAVWATPSLIAFWISVLLTWISGAIYLMPNPLCPQAPCKDVAFGQESLVLPRFTCQMLCPRAFWGYRLYQFSKFGLHINVPGRTFCEAPYPICCPTLGSGYQVMKALYLC
jgi:hypothetical protein